MTYKIKKSPIYYSPKHEKISVVVRIKEVDDDISHDHGFELSFLGESYTLDYDIHIINLLSPNQRGSIDELISKIVPGSLWLIEGEYLLLMHHSVLVLFPTEYQALELPESDGNAPETLKKRYGSIKVIEKFNKQTIEAFKKDLKKTIDIRGTDVSGIIQILNDMNKWFLYPEDPQKSDYIEIISNALDIDKQVVAERFSLERSGLPIRKPTEAESWGNKNEYKP